MHSTQKLIYKFLCTRQLWQSMEAHLAGGELIGGVYPLLEHDLERFAFLSKRIHNGLHRRVEIPSGLLAALHEICATSAP